jgi:secreted trypsin-like serine protease
MKGLGIIFLIFPSVFLHPAKDSKIVGGENAVEHSAPFMVTLQADRTGSGVYRHTCGGSILNPSRVLTAAHCVMEPLVPYQIVAGQHNLAVASGREQIRKVSSFSIHERFVAGPVVGPFDVAVLRLESPLLFVAGVVGSINLPVTNTVPSGNVQLYGWGSTSQTQIPAIPDILQTVTKPIIQWDLCREIVNAVFDHEPLHSSNICTGPLDSVVTACSG